MWYPVSDVVSEEPITLAEASQHAYAEEDDFVATVTMLIASARAHAERYCNRQFASHAMIWACDSFDDLERLPAAPLVSVTSIAYVDEDGADQTLSGSIYDVRADGLDPNVVLVDGEAWPEIKSGSRITLTGVFGDDLPPDVKHGMLVLIASGFSVREDEERPEWSFVDSLFSNYRRGAW